MSLKVMDAITVNGVILRFAVEGRVELCGLGSSFVFIFVSTVPLIIQLVL
jgi:hypothetical protein